MKFDNLNKCVRSEISAIETYQQALDKHRTEYGQHAGFQQLSGILADHQETLSTLRSSIQQSGGTPSSDSGAWGTWSKTVMATAKLFGDKAALKALKEGEESGLKEYQSIIDDDDATQEMKTAITRIVPKQRQHVAQLDALIAAI